MSRVLPTSRGDYDVPSYQLWSERGSIRNASTMLQPGARVAILGSCIAEQASSYLRRRGYDSYYSPGGYLYNPQSMRIELERVLLDRPWPLEALRQVPGSSSYVHLYRKGLRADSRADMEARDAAITQETGAALAAADVIMCIIGTTTEVWRSRPGGVPINEIPHPAIFAAGGWDLDLGALADLREEVRAIRSLLIEHTEASVAWAICPIPLYTTWADQSVVSMSGRVKALMRVALDLELAPDDLYVPMWDWMLAQTGRWSPTRPDGRHFDWVGIDHLMHFTERYLGGPAVPPLSALHRLKSTVKDAAYRVGIDI